MSDSLARIRRARRRMRREAWLDRLADLGHRPVCWVIGHRWLNKMDLRGAAICGRCSAYRAVC